MEKVCRSSKKYFSALTFLIILVSVLLVTPEVQAYTGNHNESFNDSDFIDESMTNVTGLNTGEVSLPHQDFVLVGSEPYISDYGADDVLVVGDIAYVMGDNDGLLLFDISDVSNPEYLSMEDTGLSSSYTATLAYEDDVIYYPAQDSLDIINVTDSDNPQLITSLEFSSIYDVVVQEGVAFVGAQSDGLVILNVSDPTTPTSIANYTDIGAKTVSSVYVVGNYAFLSLGTSYHIVNVTDIQYPTQVSNIDYVGSGVASFVVHDDYLVSQVGIFDVSNVSEPVRIGDFHTTGKIDFQLDIMFNPRLGGGLEVYNYSDPENLQLLYDGPECNSIKVVGDYLVTVSDENVLNIYQYRDGTEYWNLYKPFAMAQSDVVFTSNGDDHIVDVTIQVDDSTPSNTAIDYYVSATNGSWWVKTTPGVKQSIQYLGQELKLRAYLSTSDDSVAPVIYSINMTCTALLEMPFAISPEMAEEIDTSSPEFEWDHISGAVGYLIQIDNSSDFDSVNLVNETLGYVHTFQVTEPLADGDWYWRVAGIDDEDQIGDFSPTSPFSIDTGSGTNTTTELFDLVALAPYILAVGGVIALIAIVVIIKKRGA